MPPQPGGPGRRRQASGTSASVHRRAAVATARGAFLISDNCRVHQRQTCQDHRHGVHRRPRAKGDKPSSSTTGDARRRGGASGPGSPVVELQWLVQRFHRLNNRLQRSRTITTEVVRNRLSERRRAILRQGHHRVRMACARCARSWRFWCQASVGHFLRAPEAVQGQCRRGQESRGETIKRDECRSNLIRPILRIPARGWASVPTSRCQ
jgi:hypothetical protein